MKVRKIRMLDSDMDLIKLAVQDRIMSNNVKAFQILTTYFGEDIEFTKDNFDMLLKRFDTHYEETKKLNQKKRELHMLEHSIKVDDAVSVKFLDAINAVEDIWKSVRVFIWENNDLQRIANNAADHTHFYTEHYEPDEPDPEAEARFWDAVMY